jgi:hypothetical protein
MTGLGNEDTIQQGLLALVNQSVNRDGGKDQPDNQWQGDQEESEQDQVQNGFWTKEFH